MKQETLFTFNFDEDSEYSVTVRVHAQQLVNMINRLHAFAKTIVWEDETK